MPTTTNYIWDEQNYLAETDGSNVVQTVYTNEPQQYGNLVSSRISGTTSYHHFDAIGSTRQLTNAAGSVTDTMAYDAWGNVVTRTGTTAIAFLWIGELMYFCDLQTGLLTVGMRVYIPTISRWTSQDPIAIGSSVDAYTYVTNSPKRYVDPSGLYLWVPGYPAPVVRKGFALPTTCTATRMSLSIASRELTIYELLDIATPDTLDPTGIPPLQLIYGNALVTMRCTFWQQSIWRMCLCGNQPNQGIGVLFQQSNRVDCSVVPSQTINYSITIPGYVPFIGNAKYDVRLTLAGRVLLNNDLLILAPYSVPCVCPFQISECAYGVALMSGSGALGTGGTFAGVTLTARIDASIQLAARFFKCIGDRGEACYGGGLRASIGGQSVAPAWVPLVGGVRQFGPYSWDAELPNVPTQKCITL